MHASVALALLAAACPLALAAPAESAPDAASPDTLRLVKTSEQDPGQWVDEKDFWDRFTSQGVNFVDITDIKDEEVLNSLSGTSTAYIQQAAAAVAYPDGAEHVDEAKKLIAQSNTKGPQTWLKKYSEFHTRHYQSNTGTDAANWLFDRVTEAAQPNGNITVAKFKHARFGQPSIIARIPGQSTDLAILGAHLDSTAGRSDARSPGADDNGSGSVTILEVLRVLATSGFKPHNTIELHWYAGEEGGLLGSRDVYAKYKAENKKVVAMLNQDMTGYSPSKKASVFVDYVDASLTTFVRKLVAEYTGVEPSQSSCGYGCSDHASATSNGFPSAHVGEDEFDRMNPNIHSNRDTYELIEWDTVQRHINLSIGFIVETSYVNAPPRKRCKKRAVARSSL